KGGALNVNADEMASAIATGLRARRLILFTDVPGILDASGKTIPRILPGDGDRLAKIISGGMIPKVQSAFSALLKGVREVWILQGKLPLAKAGGTLIARGPVRAAHPFA
ncbi:MAG TPA: acetylglutamate kinase, partial [Planctomycetota bacterium]|nr:acetylglutamate kinase [Planctomycetota bacterium]